MIFKIDWTEKSLRQLNNLDQVISSRIVKKINELREEPFYKIKRLKGIGAFSLRIGDYRVILDIDVNNKIIYILKIGHRKNIYDK
ncbi:type II toxin-antitoxin system RelE/ParE family toxin [Candidatus Pacearchaeota archaeon]|nr:type II toxin-antitoxin system RelE/ParE family toxin [Candidatus Pacearchaeota archaeon]